MTKINGVSNQEFEKFEKCFVQQSNDKVRNLGPHNCEKQVYSGSQINKDTKILCGGRLMTGPPTLNNINTGNVGNEPLFQS